MGQRRVTPTIGITSLDKALSGIWNAEKNQSDNMSILLDASINSITSKTCALSPPNEISVINAFYSS